MDPSKNPYNTGKRTWHTKMIAVFLVLLTAIAFFTYELMLSKKGAVTPTDHFPTKAETPER